MACLSLLCSGQVGAPQSREPSGRIRIRKYRFSIEIPSGWRTRIGEDGLPIFVNFPWARMQAQLRLPERGAIIRVAAWDNLRRRRGDESLAGWAKLDTVIAAPRTVATRVIDVPSRTEISEAILVSFDEATFGPDDQVQRDVRVYWSYRGKRFAAYLNYIIGDTKGNAYEALLKQIVFGIRPLR